MFVDFGMCLQLVYGCVRNQARVHRGCRGKGKARWPGYKAAKCCSIHSKEPMQRELSADLSRSRMFLSHAVQFWWHKQFYLCYALITCELCYVDQLLSNSRHLIACDLITKSAVVWCSRKTIVKHLEHFYRQLFSSMAITSLPSHTMLLHLVTFLVVLCYYSILSILSVCEQREQLVLKLNKLVFTHIAHPQHTPLLCSFLCKYS